MPQSLYARCPECATVFRVTEQLLSVAKGRVRCGACLHIFKATDHLVRPKVEATAGAVAANRAEVDRQERETSIARSADRLAAAIKASETVSQPELLSANASDQLAIHHSRSQQQAEFPIQQWGKHSGSHGSELPEADREHSDGPEPADSWKSTDRPESEQKLEPTEALTGPMEQELLPEFDLAEPSVDDLDPLEPSEDDIEAFTQDELDQGEDDLEPAATMQANQDVTPEAWDLEPLDYDPSEQGEPAIESESVEAVDATLETTLEFELEPEDIVDERAAETPVSPDASNDRPLFEENENQQQPEYPDLELPEEDEQPWQMDELTAETGEDFEPLPKEDDLLDLETADELSADHELSFETQRETQDNHDDLNDDYEESLDPLSVKLQPDVAEPDPLDEFDDIVAEKNHTYKWLALTALIVVALVWSGVTLWQDRQTLAWDDTWGGLVHGMCTLLPCDLKPRRDVAAIELIQRDIGPSESDPEITEFSLVIRNNAAFDQPYPLVKIRFTDTRGEVVAEELHPPETYLAQDMVKTFMPSGQKVHIVIRAQKSYAGAFGFEFSFQ